MSPKRCKHGLLRADGTDCDDLCRLEDVEVLQWRMGQLREALRVYGGHTNGCPGRPCSCGFQEEWGLYVERR